MKVLIENFIEKIETGDGEKALAAIDLILEKLGDDVDLIVEICNPEIITNLHQQLIDHLDVAPRAMQLNRRFPNTGVRALMFTKAMRNGILHSIKVTNAEAEKAAIAEKATFLKAEDNSAE
jgi:hypothetical protein